MKATFRRREVAFFCGVFCTLVRYKLTNCFERPEFPNSRISLTKSFLINRVTMDYKAYSVQEATKKLEGYCAYQERCHKEVVNKLRDMQMIPEAIDQIVVHLIEANYLNEERFAQSFARGKFKIKKWGRSRITAELKQRGISRFNISTALKEIDDTAYLKTFDALAEKRVAQLTESNRQKRKKKLADYLLYRGWESHLVYDKIKELIP